MSHRISLFATLMVVLGTTGCHALGGRHTVTGITPTSYVTRPAGSQTLHAIYEAPTNSPDAVEFATNR